MGWPAAWSGPPCHVSSACVGIPPSSPRSAPISSMRLRHGAVRTGGLPTSFPVTVRGSGWRHVSRFERCHCSSPVVGRLPPAVRDGSLPETGGPRPAAGRCTPLRATESHPRSSAGGADLSLRDHRGGRRHLFHASRHRPPGLHHCEAPPPPHCRPGRHPPCRLWEGRGLAVPVSHGTRSTAAHGRRPSRSSPHPRPLRPLHHGAATSAA